MTVTDRQLQAAHAKVAKATAAMTAAVAARNALIQRAAESRSNGEIGRTLGLSKAQVGKIVSRKDQS